MEKERRGQYVTGKGNFQEKFLKIRK